MPYKYNPCVTCCSCNAATTQIGVSITNSWGGNVDWTQVTVSVTFGGNPVGSCSFTGVGGTGKTCSVGTTNRGVHVVTVTAHGQSVSANVTVNSNCTVSGSASFNIMGLTLGGCAAALAGASVNVTGQAVVGGTTDSTGGFWWLYNGAGTYHVDATETSGRFNPLSADIVSTTTVRRFSSSFSLTVAAGYVCVSVTCFTFGTPVTSYLCNYPLPTTLHGTLWGHPVTLNWTGSAWRGSFTQAPLAAESATIPEDPCKFLVLVCSPECNDPPSTNCKRTTNPPSGCLPFPIAGSADVTVVVVASPYCVTDGGGTPIGVGIKVDSDVYACCYDGGDNPSTATRGEHIWTIGSAPSGVINNRVPCYPLDVEMDVIVPDPGTQPNNNKGAQCYTGGDLTVTLTE